LGQIRRRGRALAAGALAIGLGLDFGIAPVAIAGVGTADDAYTTPEDTPLDVGPPGVRANDPAGPATCIALVDASSLAGEVTLHTDGSFTYLPDENFNGQTAFTYGLMGEETEGCPGPYAIEPVVTITVEPVNDAPTAQGDAFQFIWNQTLNIPGPGVLANDGDIDGDVLTAVKVNEPIHGVLTLAANGGFSYTPAAAACPGRPDAFSYRASDGEATSPIRTVQLNRAALPCPTAPPAATATPVPTPTPAPTATVEPSPSPSAEPSASVEPGASASPEASFAPPTNGPSASPAPEPIGESGGVSLPVLLVLVLLVVLLAFGAAFYVPRWIEARRTGGEVDDSR
jgi:hypothetical protein